MVSMTKDVIAPLKGRSFWIKTYPAKEDNTTCITVATVVTKNELRNGRSSLVTVNTYSNPSRLKESHQSLIPLWLADNLEEVATTNTFHIGTAMIRTMHTKSRYMTIFWGILSSLAKCFFFFIVLLLTSVIGFVIPKQLAHHK